MVVKELEVMHNSNGRDYKVLDTCVFNAVDTEYYKNSWQNFAYALLQDMESKTFVVASSVGETSWGNGAYYREEEEQDARERYNAVCKRYRES